MFTTLNLYSIVKIFGVYKNNLESSTKGFMFFLKNLIIFLILDSSSSLGVSKCEKLNPLSCGPWNNSSRFGLSTCPVTLVDSY